MSGDIKGTEEGTWLKKEWLFFVCEFFPVPKYWNHLSKVQKGRSFH
jgi:hypothetical protein